MSAKSQDPESIVSQLQIWFLENSFKPRPWMSIWSANVLVKLFCLKFAFDYQPNTMQNKIRKCNYVSQILKRTLHWSSLSIKKDEKFNKKFSLIELTKQKLFRMKQGFLINKEQYPTTYNILANVSNGFEARFLHHLCTTWICYVLTQQAYQVWPQALWQFCTCNVGNTLGCWTWPHRLCSQAGQYLRNKEQLFGDN